jgi:hypothetical protein
VRRGRAQALATPGGLFLAATLALCALPVTSAIRDPDFWWHLRTGQLIADRHALLTTDPFTYTASGHPWTMHEWLTEVSFAGLHHLGGLGLIVAVLSVATWLGLLCVFLRARLRRPHYLALGMGMLLAVTAGYPIWGPRAQMITFALTCLTLFLVERHLRRGGRAIWLLVPVMLVWSNLHSGFIIGLGFVVLVVAAEAAARRLGWRGAAPAGNARGVLLVLLACLAVVAINPNGPRIYLYPFETQGSPAQQSLILEWHSPDFHDASVVPFEVMLLTLALMVTVTRRLSPRDAVLALATTAMALQSVRHIALFVAAVTPLWIEQADLIGRRAVAAWSTRQARPATTRPGVTSASSPARMLLAALVIAVLSLVAATKLAAAATTREDSLFYAKDFPVCAARWLSAAPTGLRIFNQYGEGGYLADRLSARGDRVFIFGDAALMGDDLLTTYGDVEEVRPDWERILRRYHTDIVVFDSGTPLVQVLLASPRWVEVYRDPHSAAFIPADRNDLRAALPPQPAYAAGSPDTCAQLARDRSTDSGTSGVAP